MQHVPGLQLVLVEGVHLHVQLVDLHDVVVGVELPVRAGVDEGPGPLLRDHAHRLLRRGQVLLDVVPDPHRAHDDEDVADEHEQVGDRDPALLALQLAGDVLGLDAVALLELEHQPEEDALAQHEPEADQPEDQHPELVGVARVGGRGRDEVLDQHGLPLEDDEEEDDGDEGADARHGDEEGAGRQVVGVVRFRHRISVLA